MIDKNPNLTEEEFQKLWNSLSLQGKKNRLERGIAILRKVAQKQLDIIESYKKSDIRYPLGPFLLVSIVEEIWKDVDFAISLGKGRNRSFIFYPTRSVLENVLRLEFYSQQDVATQNDMARREMLRIAKRYYELEKSQGRDTTNLKDFYDQMAKGSTSPDIDDAKENDDPFGAGFIKIQATSKTLMFKNMELYTVYQGLAELTHGKMLSRMILELDDFSEYVRCLMYLHTLSIACLKITDSHLEGKTTTDINAAVKKSEYISKKSSKNAT